MRRNKKRLPPRMAHCHYLAARYSYTILTELPGALGSSQLTPDLISQITGIPLSSQEDYTQKQLLACLKIKDKTPDYTRKVQQNLRKVSELFELPAAFITVLEYIFLLNVNHGIHYITHYIDIPDAEQSILWLLETKTGLEQATIKTLYKSLIEQGLFYRGYSGLEYWRIAEPLLGKITDTVIESKEDFLSSLLTSSSPSQFTLDDFGYVNTTLLSDYLAQAIAQRHTGVNILLYGPAGTGKTELAKTLSATMQRKLQEVGSQVLDDGKLVERFNTEYITGQRLQYLRLILSLLKNNADSILLIDECESLFLHADFGYTKNSLHQLMENNTIPCIWITNFVGCMENSFIRRFKLAVEVESPDAAKLLSITRTACKGLSITEECRKAVSQTKNITPAIIQNAAYIARTVGRSRKAAESVVSEVIEQTLKACFEWESPLLYQAQMPFEEQFLNIKQPRRVIDDIRYAIKKSQPVRVLLCGPPGTGKTAYAHYLTEQHQRELIRVQCSDILSKYVGESEQLVKRLFHQAHHEGKALLLDEVDSLLTSRDQLQAQHERQLVNELLAQLECDYLTAEQVITLYQRVLRTSRLTADESQQLQRLTRLTPGDFAILVRRMRFQPKQNHRQTALSVLADENQRKQPPATIGFVR